MPPGPWQRSFVGSSAEAIATAAWLEETGMAAAMPPETLFAMQVCLEELLTNILKYSGQVSPRIEVTVRRDPQGYALVVENEGMPFDITGVERRPLEGTLSDIEPGGLGVLLVQKFSDHLSFSREGLGNRVVAEFHTPQNVPRRGEDHHAA